MLGRGGAGRGRGGEVPGRTERLPCRAPQPAHLGPSLSGQRPAPGLRPVSRKAAPRPQPVPSVSRARTRSPAGLRQERGQGQSWGSARPALEDPALRPPRRIPASWPWPPSRLWPSLASLPSPSLSLRVSRALDTNAGSLAGWRGLGAGSAFPSWVRYWAASLSRTKLLATSPALQKEAPETPSVGR